MEAPRCKLCKARHWLGEPHKHAKAPTTERNVSRETINAPDTEVRYDWAARARELGLP